MQAPDQSVAVAGLLGGRGPGGEGLLLYVIVSVETIDAARDAEVAVVDGADGQVEEVAEQASVGGDGVEGAREGKRMD